MHGLILFTGLNCIAQQNAIERFVEKKTMYRQTDTLSDIVISGAAHRNKKSYKVKNCY